MAAKVDPGDGLVRIKLLKEEIARYAQHNGIQSLTFYNGERNAAGMSGTLGCLTQHLKTRVMEMLEANPWLAGTMENATTLVYNPNPGEKELDSILFFPYKHLGVSREEDDYYDINNVAVEEGNIGDIATQLKFNRPVTKIIAALCNEGSDDECVVSVAMSHYIVDGQTYYSVLNMLGSKSTATKLTIDRVEQSQYTKKEIELCGAANPKYGSSLTYIKHILWNNVLKKNDYTDILCHYIDEEAIEGAKKKRKEDQEYISTNDILVSQYATISKADLFMQTHDYRRRMPDVFSEDLAGNYENVMLLSNKGYTSPALVRKSLTDGFPLNHTVETGKLPGFCSKVRLTFHSSFIPRRPLDLAIEGCEQLLHLPLMMLTPTDYLSCPLDFSIMFQATPTRRAYLIFCKRGDPEEYAKMEGLGESLPMFPCKQG